MVCASYQILFVCCRAVSATEDVAPPPEVKSEPGQYAILIVIISWSACCTPYIVSDPVFMCITFCRRARVLYLITLYFIT